MEAKLEVECRCWINSRIEVNNEFRTDWLWARTANGLGAHEEQKDQNNWQNSSRSVEVVTVWKNKARQYNKNSKIEATKFNEKNKKKIDSREKLWQK